MKNLCKFMVTDPLIIILVSRPSLSEALFNNLRQGRFEHANTFIKLGDNHNQFIDKKNRVSRESLQSDIKPLCINKYERKAELSLLCMKMQANAKEIKAKRKELHNLRRQLQEKTTDYRLAFRDTLTPRTVVRVGCFRRC